MPGKSAAAVRGERHRPFWELTSALAGPAASRRQGDPDDSQPHGLYSTTHVGRLLRLRMSKVALCMAGKSIAIGSQKPRGIAVALLHSRPG